MSAGPSVPGATDALKRFELENNISEIDQIYSFDNAEQQQHVGKSDGGKRSSGKGVAKTGKRAKGVPRGPRGP